jgi:hypothetical protein
LQRQFAAAKTSADSIIVKLARRTIRTREAGCFPSQPTLSGRKD